jgi:uncharacterized protein YndB with AHSA1/START domain
MTMSYTTPKQTELTVTRVIAATPAEIYDAWLDDKQPGGPWFGCQRVILDAKVDGLFYHAVVHEGHQWAHYGRFVALDRPRRIEQTWVSEGTRGLESHLELTLEPDGDGTRVTLRHSGVPDDDFGRQHRDGWEFVLGGLAQRFAKLTPR